MSEANDLDELLAALTDETRVHPDVQSGILPNQHQTLAPMHSNVSLGSLTDEITFNLHDQHNLGLNTGGHLSDHNIGHMGAPGVSQIPSNVSANLLGSSIAEDAFSNQGQEDSSSMQVGSSLGSLFLDSVDEILSNEKTTQQFPAPQVKATVPKPSKPVMTKQGQLLSDKTPKSGVVNVGQSTIDSSPLGENQHGHQSSSMHAFSPVNRSQTSQSGSSVISGTHSFIGRQQTVQLTRPRSNASDTTFYPGSVPQPSPAGSVDSNINPRTPLSNNPNTPQSMQPRTPLSNNPNTPQSMQPLTPQSNLPHGNHSNRPTSASSQPQVQQHVVNLPEHDFFPVDHTILDDQSHLQYLNTSSCSTAGQVNIGKTTLSYQTPSTYLQGQELMLPHDFSHSVSFPSLIAPQQSTSRNLLPSANWQPNMLATPSTTTAGQPQLSSNLNFVSQKKTDSLPIDLISDTGPGSFGSLSGNVFYTNTTTNSNVPVASYLTQRIDVDNYGSSEGLTQTQSQLLDTLSIKGKNKSKSSKPTEAQPIAEHQMTWPDMQFGQLDKPNKLQHSVEAFTHSQEQAHLGRVEKSIHKPPESGFKQYLSQSYEAVSPASIDNSPMSQQQQQQQKQLQQKRLYNSLPSETTSAVSRNVGAASSLSPHASSVTGPPRPSEDKPKAGPLARRRSASKEKKIVPNPPKTSDTAEFNFEDDFGSDPNEPTIRLQTKKNNQLDQIKTVPASQSNPIVVQTMQRENYSEASVFQSVQELAVLKQKQQSLMEALNASRNAKIPSKSSKFIQKSTNPILSRTSLPMEVRGMHTSNKQQRSRKPSKTDSTKDDFLKSKAKTGVELKNQGAKQKASVTSKSDDFFCQQFLNSTSSKNITSTTLSSLPPTQKRSDRVPGFPSAFAQEQIRSTPSFSSLQHRSIDASSRSTQLIETAKPISNSSSLAMSRLESARIKPNASTTATSNYGQFVSRPVSKVNLTSADLPTPLSRVRGQVTNASSTSRVPAAGNLTENLIASSNKSNVDTTYKTVSHSSFDPDVFSFFNPEASSQHSGNQFQKEKTFDPWNSHKSVVATTTKPTNVTISASSSFEYSSSSISTTSRSTTTQENVDVLNSLIRRPGHPAYTIATTSMNLPEFHQASFSKSITSTSLPVVSDTSDIRFDTLSRMPTSAGASGTATNTQLWPGTAGLKHSSVMQSSRSKSPAQTLVTTHHLPSTTLATQTSNQTKQSMAASNIPNFANVYYPSTTTLASNLDFSSTTDVFSNFMSQRSFFEAQPAMQHLPSSLQSDPAVYRKSIEFLRSTQQKEKQSDTVSSFKPSTATLSTSTLVDTLPITCSANIANIPEKRQLTSNAYSRSSLQAAVDYDKQQSVVSTSSLISFPSSTSQTFPEKSSLSSATKTVNIFNASTPANFPGKTAIVTCSASANLPFAKTLTTKAPEQSLLTSTVDILKDKTYHGPKKKHILEKYTLQTQKPAAPLVSPKPINTAKPNGGKTDVNLSENNLSNNRKTLQNENKAVSPSGSRPKPNDKILSSEQNKPVKRNEQKSNEKGESGSIFSVFASLLQEATESAEDSLAIEPVKKKPTTSKTNKETTKMTTRKGVEKVKDSAVTTKKSTTVSKATSKTTSVTTAPPTGMGSTKTATALSDSQSVSRNPATFPFKRRHVQIQHKTTLTSTPVVTTTTTTSISKMAVTVRTTKKSVEPTKKTVETRKTYEPSKKTVETRKTYEPTKKTVETRKTYEPTKKTVETRKAYEPTKKTVETRKTYEPTKKTVETKKTYEPTKKASESTKKAVELNKKSLGTTKKAIETSKKTDEQNKTNNQSIQQPVGVLKPPIPTVASNSTVTTRKTQIQLTTAPSSPSVALRKQTVTSNNDVGLKLRITAFRSSDGQVIYQSRLMGDLFNVVDTSDNEEYYRRKKRKKRKKRRKRLKKLMAKINKSLGSINNPPIPIRPPSSDDSDAISEPLAGRKRKGPIKLANPSLAAIQIDSSASVDSESEKTSQHKSKRPSKVVARYKLKNKSQVSIEPVSSTVSLHRQPGKPPLYLAAGANQALVSGSTPTIQLGFRSISKSIVKSVATSAPTLRSEVSGIKLITTPLKSSVASILPKANQIRIQTSSAAGSSSRIIVPKIIPPSTFSVGKATVFTVSSSGARVISTPKVQTHPTSSQTTSAKVSTVSSLSNPLVVKRVSILPKSSLTTATNNAKRSDARAAVNVASTMPCVVSFTSKPVKASNKIVVPKPVLATSKSSPLAIMGGDMSMPRVIIPTITEAVDKNDNLQCADENEFQSAFTKLISTPNPLSKYVPPSIPLEYLSLMEDESSTCQQCFECGDNFLFNRSLSHHYERRSILVKVRCVQCSQMLVFFNKCEILRHAREHSEHGEVMQFNGANLRPIPLSLCRKRSKDEFLAAVCDVTKSSSLTGEGRKTTECAMACTECPYVTDGKGTLEEHFQRRDGDLRPCDICKLPLRNQCVFSAHMRMHRHATPQTCPECGQTFDGNKMEFNLHLRIQCFHLGRTSCYKCKLCNLVFLTDDQLRHHLRQNHVQMFYKCKECPMAFKTTQNIANHQRSAHNLTPEPTNILKTIYKCPLCESVFTDSNHSQQLFVLHKHFDGHIESARITAYKCYLCTRLFEQKAPLRDHLQQEHDFSALDEMNCTYDVTAESNHARQASQSAIGEGENRPNLKSNKSKSEVIHSDSSSTSHSNRKRHADEDFTENSPKSKLKKVNRTPFKMRIKGLRREPKLVSRHTSSSSSLSGDSPPLAKSSPVKNYIINSKGKKIYPCPECEKEFHSSHSRSSHVGSVHRGIRALYCCTHCPVGTVKFAKRITLVKHLCKVHGVKNPQKDEIKIIRTHVPFVPGEKFKAASVKMDKDGKVVTESKAGAAEKKKPRKKFTSGQAKARRLAVAAGKRMRRTLKSEVSISDSEESYGEVDEKLVEEGWQVEDEPSPKLDINEKVDASLFDFPDVYTCVKCDFQHGDRIVFQDHIIDHSQLLDPTDVNNISAVLTMVQCTECGLCFASGASLDKHMHIKHKIKRRALLERYDAKLREERQNLLASGADLDPSTIPGGGHLSNIHRCKVCFRKFDSEPELKTHMRTHGLAFVKSKQH